LSSFYDNCIYVLQDSLLLKNIYDIWDTQCLCLFLDLYPFGSQGVALDLAAFDLDFAHARVMSTAERGNYLCDRRICVRPNFHVY